MVSEGLASNQNFSFSIQQVSTHRMVLGELGIRSLQNDGDDTFVFPNHATEIADV